MLGLDCPRCNILGLWGLAFAIVNAIMEQLLTALFEFRFVFMGIFYFITSLHSRKSLLCYDIFLIIIFPLCFSAGIKWPVLTSQLFLDT